MFIPDPNFFHSGSQIRIKEFKYFDPKNWFLRSRKYDLGCSSRIPDSDFLPIPDPGVKKAPNPGFWIRIRNTVGITDGKSTPVPVSRFYKKSRLDCGEERCVLDAVGKQRYRPRAMSDRRWRRSPPRTISTWLKSFM
jgi:hypothetical protein